MWMARPRTGLAPVVAVLVMVLLAVVTAGGAWAFISGITEEAQGEADSSLRTEIVVRDITCRGVNASVTFSNVGDAVLSSDRMEVYLYQRSNGELIGTDTVDISGAAFRSRQGVGSTWASFNATTEKGKTYRVSFSFPADDYSVETSCESGATRVGEVHTVTVSGSSWTTLNFERIYDQPLVLATTNTKSSGDQPLIPQARNVQPSSAEIRLCEHEDTDACASAGTETIGVLVLDADRVDQLPGAEAGRFTVGSGGGSPFTTSASFTAGFTNPPIVFVTPQTANGGPEFSMWVTGTTSSGFTVARCDHNETSTNSCTDHAAEDVGWLAVDPASPPFQNLRAGRTASEYGGNSWASISYNTLQTPVAALGMIQGDDGGQDPKVSETRNVGASSMEVWFCEHDSTDGCDGHADNFLAWLAATEGPLLY